MILEAQPISESSKKAVSSKSHESQESQVEEKSQKSVDENSDEKMEEEKKFEKNKSIELSSKNEDKLDLDEESKSADDSIQYIREEIGGKRHVVTHNGRIVEVEPPELRNNSQPEMSPHWRRIDVRQKRITRGLSSLAKDFIQSWMKRDKKRKKNFFEALDNLLRQHFLYIYRKKRIQAHGGLGRIVLMCKFEKLVASSTYLSEADKKKILNFGGAYTKIK